MALGSRSESRVSSQSAIKNGKSRVNSAGSTWPLTVLTVTVTGAWLRPLAAPW